MFSPSGGVIESMTKEIARNRRTLHQSHLLQVNGPPISVFRYNRLFLPLVPANHEFRLPFPVQKVSKILFETTVTATVRFTACGARYWKHVAWIRVV